MTYIGNLDYWDDKFKSRGDKALSPDQSLVDNISMLKKGRVLDLACGDGRNSLYLASLSWIVTGLDFSLHALERLNRFSAEYDYDIETRKVDLSKENAFEALGSFDTIIINHYKISPNLMMQVHEHLTDQGTLFVSGFSKDHPVDNKIKSNDLILEEDFESLVGMKLIHHETFSDQRGHFVTFIYKKDKHE